MTRIECERLVERYLEGSLDFAEEENFFIQVALNEELRRTLKAYRIVEETLQKQRILSGANHAATRSIVAAALVPAFQPEHQGEPSSTFQHRERKLSWVFVSAIAGAALLFGGLFAVEDWGDPVIADSPKQVISATEPTEAFVGTLQEETAQTNLVENNKSLSNRHRKDIDFVQGSNRNLLPKKESGTLNSSPLDPRDKAVQAQVEPTESPSMPVVPFTSPLPAPAGQRSFVTDSVTISNVDLHAADTGSGISVDTIGTSSRQSRTERVSNPVERGDD
ncbi:MAG: hypothetical protein AB7H80_03890 [Candidatus Kapaibacterium sp.]